MKRQRHGETVHHWRIWRFGITIYRRRLATGEYGFSDSRGFALTICVWKDLR